MRIPLSFGPVDQPGIAWDGRYRCEWGEVVGRRARTLRQNEDLYIREVAAELRRADGRPYSSSFVSRLERGWASPPLYVYCLLARRFEVAPGELLGSEGVERPVSDAEMTLVRVIRRLGLSPEDAIAARASRAGAPTSLPQHPPGARAAIPRSRTA